MNNKRVWIIAGVAFVILLPFIYKTYSVNIQERKEINVINARAEAVRQEEIIEKNRIQKIQECKTNVEEFINDIEWDRQCRLIGKEDECRLPENIYKQLMDAMGKQQADCDNKY
ncbi:MAG: hypothetical protein WCW16_03095 [Candidatus Magasanikbacteria bacterium]|jgi:hypothetical protein